MLADCHGAIRNDVLAPLTVGFRVSREIRAAFGIDRHHRPSIGDSAAGGHAVRLALDRSSSQGTRGSATDPSIFKRYHVGEINHDQGTGPIQTGSERALALFPNALGYRPRTTLSSRIGRSCNVSPGNVTLKT